MDSRIESSFYSDILKKLEVYEYIITKIYPRGLKSERGYGNNLNKLNKLIRYPCFKHTKVGYYFKTLYEGE